MSTWYYTDAEQQRQGPLSTDELKHYFRREAILDDTLVWRDGMMHWRPLGELAVQLGLREAAEPAAAEASALSLAPRMPPPPPAPLQPAPTAAPEPAMAVAHAPASGRAVFDLGSDPVELAPPSLGELAEIRSRAASSFDSEQELNPYRPAQAALYPRTHIAHGGDVVYAGFWKRAAALIVDSMIAGVIGRLGGEALGALLADLVGGGAMAVVMLSALVNLALNVCYYAFFYSTARSATPGKMLVGIKVVRSNGEPISFLRGVARVFATIPSSIILFIGYLMVAFTQRKQALHDMICDTVVVDKWAFTGQPELQQEELGTAAVVILAGYALLIVLAVILVVALGSGAFGRAG